jgi:hypothetical protein
MNQRLLFPIAEKERSCTNIFKKGGTLMPHAKWHKEKRFWVSNCAACQFVRLINSKFLTNNIPHPPIEDEGLLIK